MSVFIDRKYLLLLSSRLRNFKHKKDSLYNFSCPICGDSKTNTLKSRGYVFAKGNDMFYRCHNCGASMNMRNFIRHMDASLYQEYVMETYLNNQHLTNSNFSGSIIKSTNFKFGKVDNKMYESAQRISELPNGHFCLDYIKYRRIPSTFWDSLLFTTNFKDFIQEALPESAHKVLNDSRLIIPFYDEYNELIGVAGRSLDGASKMRYITIRSSKYPKKVIYGLDRLNTSKRVIIVEGQFDSMFLDNAIASCDSALSTVLDDYSFKNYVLVFDNEPRNKEIIHLMELSIKKGHNIVIWNDMIKGKDINEMILQGMTQEQIMNYIDQNTFNGPIAQLKLNTWKRV